MATATTASMTIAFYDVEAAYDNCIYSDAKGALEASLGYPVDGTELWEHLDDAAQDAVSNQVSLSLWIILPLA